MRSSKNSKEKAHYKTAVRYSNMLIFQYSYFGKGYPSSFFRFAAISDSGYS